MTYDEAVEIFGPIFPALEQTVRAAFDAFYDVHRNELLMIGRRTKASEINDRITNELAATLQGAGTVHAVSAHNTLLFVFDERCVIRAKKLDSFGRARYHHTLSSRAFDCNPSLFDAGTMCRLYFGYVVDRGTNELDRVVLARPGQAPGEPADWIIDITEENAQQVQMFRAPRPVVPAVTAKVTLKKARK